MIVSMSLSIAVREAIHGVQKRGDTAERILITFTPDALPVLGDMLSDLWAITRWWDVAVEYPEDPAFTSLPRYVAVRAEGTHTWAERFVTAEAVRDSITVPLS